jgi:DNA-binding beta-propeller fold protein YncE
VCDRENNRVQIFSSNGKFLRTFGSKGKKNGQFNYPVSVTIDHKYDLIIVCDRNNNRIQIFDQHGNFRQAIGSKGKLDLQFNHPVGVAAIDSTIVVFDYGNHRIQVVSYCI